MADSHEVLPQGRRGIGRQIVLPLSKAFEIAWKGIKIRIWRSLITMSGIILAIAFLTSVWTSGVFTRALRNVKPTDEMYPLVQDALEAEAIAGGGVRVRCAVLARAEEGPSAERATPAVGIRGFLDALEAFRAESIAPSAEAIVGSLSGQEGPAATILVGLPEAVSAPDVGRGLEDYVKLGGLLLLYGTGGLQTPTSAGQDLLAGLLPGTLAGGTFSTEGSRIEPGERLGQVLWQNHPGATFARTSGKPGAEPLATADGQALGWRQDVGEGSVVWYAVAPDSEADPNVLSWFLRGGTVEAAVEPGGRGGLLIRLLTQGAGATGQQGDMRGVWLVTLSLMVCVVGITNAMLMSVTERFREIGTMKCLGALDKFVVKLFLIESSLQGVVGSLLGAAIGFLLSFVRALFTFHITDVQTGEGHWLALGYFPALGLLGWGAVAVGTGIVLSVVAAIYPAIRAARMEPVQAMRVEA